DGTRRFAQQITPDPGGSALTSGLGGRPLQARRLHVSSHMGPYTHYPPTLHYDFGPAQRGLARADDSLIWTFPGDYLSRLEASVFAADPELARRARALEAESA
ncbi:MAG TPA: hypothetical protein VIL01_01255, partial [Thermomicrobiales bacterium]